MWRNFKRSGTGIELENLNITGMNWKDSVVVDRSGKELFIPATGESTGEASQMEVNINNLF